MRKMAVILSLIILTGSMTACNNSNESSFTQGNSEIQSTSQEKNEDDTLTISSVRAFSDGFAWVHLKDSVTGKIKCACIDTKGKIQFYLDDIVTCKSYTKDYVTDFTDGYSIVTDENEVTYIINTEGRIIASSKDNDFTNVISYGDGYFAVENCKNDLHSVEYTASILDNNGAYIIKDWIKSENKIENLDYFGDNVFKYVSQDGYYENEYECYNVSTGKSFSLKDCTFESKFNDNKAIIYHYFDNYFELLYSNGKTERLDLHRTVGDNHSRDDREIFDNAIVFQKENDDSLYLYDISSGKSSTLYVCGNGVSANIAGYSNGDFLLTVNSSNNSGGKSDWFVLIDKQGNNLFEPIEGKIRSFSCDRIITMENIIYDTKGNAVTVPQNYEIDTKYNDNLLCVKSPEYNYSGYDDYIDINGNLLFNGNMQNNQ